MQTKVYLPRVGTDAVDPLTQSIKQGSGIVGSDAEEWLAAKYGEPVVAPYEGRLVIDYEGALFGQVNMRTFADRVMHAAGRHRQHYPTVARHVVEPAQLVEIGYYDDEAERVELLSEHADALADWLEIARHRDGGRWRRERLAEELVVSQPRYVR